MNFRLAIHLILSLFFFLFLLINGEDFDVLKIGVSFVLFWFMHFLLIIFFDRKNK